MNTEFKGTKNDWFYSTLDSEKCEFSVMTNDKVIADVRIIDQYNKDIEGKANAQLIATAPELLEALIELIQVKEWKDKYGKDAQYLKAQPIAWENAKEAIQKALNP